MPQRVEGYNPNPYMWEDQKVILGYMRPIPNTCTCSHEDTHTPHFLTLPLARSVAHW